MVTESRIRMTDISRQKRFEVVLDSGEELSSRETVRSAVDLFLTRSHIPDGQVEWAAYSRGRKLDDKQTLDSLTEADREWRIIPQVSAGSQRRQDVVAADERM